MWPAPRLQSNLLRRSNRWNRQSSCRKTGKGDNWLKKLLLLLPVSLGGFRNTDTMQKNTVVPVRTVWPTPRNRGVKRQSTYKSRLKHKWGLMETLEGWLVDLPPPGGAASAPPHGRRRAQAAEGTTRTNRWSQSSTGEISP